MSNHTTMPRIFDEATMAAVWRKATAVPGFDQDFVRKDRCGAWIKFLNYGNVDSDYGWEIDHEKPVSKGGTDNINNLQPLHWKNNRGKGEIWPDWPCSYSAKA